MGILTWDTARMSMFITGLWAGQDHLCRHCFGRLWTCIQGPLAGFHRCSQCGATANGQVESLCACGLCLKDGVPAIYQCTPNPSRTHQFDREVVIYIAEKRKTTAQAAAQNRGRTAQDCTGGVQLAAPIKLLAQ